MKNTKHLISTLLVLSVLFSVANAQGPNDVDSLISRLYPQGFHGYSRYVPNIIVPYYIYPELSPSTQSPGEVQVTIRISPLLAYDSAKVRIHEIENLKIIGDTVWILSATTKDTITYTLNLDIPANDTSGFRIEVEYARGRQHVYYYFITNDEKIYTSRSKIVRIPKPKPKPPNSRKVIGLSMVEINRQIHENQEKRRNSVRITYKSNIRIEIPSDSFYSWVKQIGDNDLLKRIATIEKSTSSMLERKRYVEAELNDPRKPVSEVKFTLLMKFLELNDKTFSKTEIDTIQYHRSLEEKLFEWDAKKIEDTTLFREVVFLLIGKKQKKYVLRRIDEDLLLESEGNYYRAVMPLHLISSLYSYSVPILIVRDSGTVSDYMDKL